MNLVNRRQSLQNFLSPGRRSAQPIIGTLESRTYFTASFSGPVNHPGITSPTGIAVADFTAGPPGIVVAGDAPSASTVPVAGVYLQSSGNFGTPTLDPFTGTASGIAAGDFQGDGNQDIAALDSSANQLDVFLNDGQGNFSPGLGGSLGGTAGDTVLATADFNGDGKVDIAAVDPADNRVVVFPMGTENGASGEASISVPSPIDVVAADFNGDSNPDLAILSSDGSVYVAINNTNGGFNAPVPYSLGSAGADPASLVMGKFTAAATPDLAVVASSTAGGAASTIVLLNNGDGTFGAANVVGAVPTNPVSILSGNFTGSGHTDLAVLDGEGGLTVIPGNGDGTFAATQSIFTDQLKVGHDAVAADLNGDGLTDIAYLDSASGGFSELLNTGGTPASPLQPSIARSSLPATAVAGSTTHGTVTVNVTNTTATNVTGNISVGVYASLDGTVDGNSILLGSVPRHPGVKKSATSPIAVAVRSLPSSLVGNFTLFAKVTDSAGNSVISAAGPTLAGAAPLIAFSDTLIRTTLTATDVSASKTRAVVQLNVTNGGNIISSGKSEVAFYFSPDTTAADGTLIRSIPESLPLKPNVGRTITVPLLNLPAVANGNYYLVAQVTDPKLNVISTASAGTYALAAPFVSLVPSAVVVTPGKGGSATVGFTVTNNGNIASTHLSHVTLFASADGTTTSATAVFTQAINLPVAPGKIHPVRLRLTAAQVLSLQSAATAILQVTDSLGESQLLPFTI